LGAILYRAGRYDEAIARLRQAVARHGSGGTADDWVLLALAEERRGNHDLALQWLRKIDQALADDGAQLRTLGRAPWRQRLGLQVLHAEARALIEPPSAVPEPAEERVSNP
jgi:tetratricopeptide (TPR) repeat protein